MGGNGIIMWMCTVNSVSAVRIPSHVKTDYWVDFVRCLFIFSF